MRSIGNHGYKVIVITKVNALFERTDNSILLYKSMQQQFCIVLQIGYHKKNSNGYNSNTQWANQQCRITQGYIITIIRCLNAMNMLYTSNWSVVCLLLA